jgi:hypothetical protein
VVQVYARRQRSDGPSRLVGFSRVDVRAGDTWFAEIEVPFGALAERDVTAHAMVVLPGRYSLRVARHATDSGVPFEIEIDRAI